MSKIKDLIENPNPIYTNNLAYWNFLLNSYEGGQDYIGYNYVGGSQKIFAGGTEIKEKHGTHLFQYKKERNDDYVQRIKMSYYYNFCSPIIDIYTNHLFKQPIIESFEGIEPLIENKKTNIDRMNNSIDEFRKSVVDLSQIYGHVFVLVDSPKIDGEVISLQQKIDYDAFPYAVIKPPQEIVNWALDQFGMPYWVLIKEEYDMNIDPMQFDKEKSKVCNYKLWDRMNWYEFNSDGVKIDEGVHGLGEVPLTVFYNKRSKKVMNFLGVSVLSDIVFIARDIYNACSELRQILREQTFATLCLQGESSDYSETEVGTSRGLLYPRETQTPQFISPPSSNAEVYFKHISNQISAIFRLAKLEGASAKFEGSQVVEQSGISKAYDFNETNQALAEKALNMEDGEAKMWRLFGLWEKKEYTGYISYAREFDISSLNEDLEEAEKMLRMQLGVEFNKEIKKAIIQKKLSRLNDEEVKAIVDNMESSEGVADSGKLLNMIPKFKKTSNQTE